MSEQTLSVYRQFDDEAKRNPKSIFVVVVVVVKLFFSIELRRF